MGDFVKEKVYKDELVGETSKDNRVEVDPKLTIPFAGSKLKGLSMGDEITVTLKGTVEGLKMGKERWDNGLTLTLSSGEIDSNSKSAEEEMVDSFAEED